MPFYEKQQTDISKNTSKATLGNILPKKKLAKKSIKRKPPLRLSDTAAAPGIDGVHSPKAHLHSDCQSECSDIGDATGCLSRRLRG